MNLEIFLAEHIAENSNPKSGSFWAMPSPVISQVSEINEQTIKNIVLSTFSSHAPSSDKIPNGLYFQIFLDKKQIFMGHIKADGEIDFINKK